MTYRLIKFRIPAPKYSILSEPNIITKRAAHAVPDELRRKRTSRPVPINKISPQILQKHKNTNWWVSAVFLLGISLIFIDFIWPKLKNHFRVKQFESMIEVSKCDEGSLARMRKMIAGLDTSEKILFLSSIRKASYDEPVFFELFRNEKSREIAIDVARDVPQVLDFINMVGYNILMDVLKKNFDEKAVRTLLELGSNPNFHDANGKSTLEHVIDYGNSENKTKLIIDFIEKGANVNDYLPFLLDEDNSRTFRKTFDTRSKEWIDKGEKRLAAFDMNKVLFRTPDHELFSSRDPNLSPEAQAEQFEKAKKLFPTVFTVLCLKNDPELITDILPYANEESLMKSIQYAATVSADKVLKILVQDRRLKDLKIENIDELIESALCEGRHNIASILIKLSGLEESDVVNYPPFLYFKLVSNFLPDPEKSAEIIEYYESLRQGTKTLKSLKPLVENEFVKEVKLPNGGSAVILAVDDTYRELEGLIFETIQSYQPENIFLPLCEERKASLFITEKEDRDILESRIRKIQELQIKQKLEGTDEKILLQKKVDDDRLQNRLYPNREIRAVFQAARNLNGCVLHFSEPKVSEVYSRMGKVSPQELEKFDVYTRSRILDLDSWKKTKSSQFRDFLAKKRLEAFPNVNDVYYAKRADYITKKVSEVSSHRSLILVDIELYDEICAKLKGQFQ